MDAHVCEHCPFGHVCEHCPLGPCLVCGCSKARDKFGDRICFCDSCKKHGCENIPDKVLEQLVGWHADELLKMRAIVDTKAHKIILGKCDRWITDLGTAMTMNQWQTLSSFIWKHERNLMERGVHETWLGAPPDVMNCPHEGHGREHAAFAIVFGEKAMAASKGNQETAAVCSFDILPEIWRIVAEFLSDAASTRSRLKALFEQAHYVADWGDGELLSPERGPLIMRRSFHDVYRLQRLDLSCCGLEGEIPKEIACCRELSKLYLQHNRLTGTIPASLWGLKKLQKLYLWGNMLVGRISAEIGNCVKLRKLWLDKNQLSGSIPTEFEISEEVDSCVLERRSAYSSKTLGPKGASEVAHV
jgi:hypothetical protein